MSDPSGTGITSTISSKIFTNSVGAITAAVLASVLTAMVAWVVANFAPVNNVMYATAQPNIECNGTFDDTVGLNAWFASIPDGSTLEFPGSGHCIFSTPLTGPATQKGLVWHFNGSDLTYTGSNTTQNLLTFGTQADSAASFCSIVGWNMHDGPKIHSNTVMTSGTAIIFFDMCDSNIFGIVADGNLTGNSNLFDGVQFAGGNNVVVGGHPIFRGGHNTALLVFGDTSQQFTDFYLEGGYVVGGSIVGINICGNVGGAHLRDGDVLNNESNVRISQDCVAVANSQVFIEPGFAADATVAGGAAHDLEVADSGGSNSILIDIGGWFASSTSDNIKFDVGTTWLATFTGGQIGNTAGAGIFSNSATDTINVVGATMWNITGGAALDNGGGTVTKCGVLFKGNTANTTGTVGSSC